MSNQFSTMSVKSLESHIERANAQIKEIISMPISLFPGGHTSLTNTIECLKDLVKIYESELYRRTKEQYSK